MALKKVPKSLIFDKGLDTKTNEKLTDGYLDLENCDVFNVGLQKSKGYVTLSQLPNDDNNYTKNIFTSRGQLAVAANNSVYEFDILNNVASKRGNFTYVERDLILTNSNGENVPNVQYSVPLLYNEYDKFGSYVYQTGTNYYLRIQNIESVININTILINANISTPGIPVGVVSTRVGVLLYIQTAAGAIDEYYWPYTSANATRSNASIILLAKNVTFAGGTCAYTGFKTITIAYDGSAVWIGYLDGGGLPNIVVRNLAGGTMTTISPVQINIPACSRVVTLASGNDDFRLASLNSFFYGSASYVKVGTNVFSGAMFFQFGTYICVIDSSSYLVYTSAFPIALPDINNKLYCQSICYLSGIIDETTLIGGINYLYVLKEDLMEYSSSTPFVPNRVFPYTIAYDLSSGVWVTTDTLPKQPANFTTADNTFGTSFVTGSLWPTLINVYFCYMSVMSSGNIGTDPDMKSTEVTQRHANYYIVDFNYNLVDFVVHFIGSTAKYTSLTSTNMIKSFPYCVVDTKQNPISSANPYLFMKNTQIEITGGQITFDNQTLIFDCVNQNKNKLVNYDRGQTGYFGITNLYMLTQSTAEYAQFLEYPTCILEFTAPGATINTFYTYAVTFEYVNPNGELFRSAPSILQSANVAVASNVTVHFTPPAAIETKSNIIIKIWRSTENATTLYLINQFTFIAGTTANKYVDNITTINTDAKIIDNELGYFNGGVVPEVAFDPFDTWILHGNRGYTVTKDNKNLLQYSLPYQPSVGMATSFGFELAIEPRGGDIIELASLDNHLVMFKRNYIYVVSGNGLDALGNNYNFTDPELLNSPVGCSEKSSVIRIPDGIMFKSVKGIYLLDRSLVASYIGAPVERYNALTISSAVLSETENKVRFFTYSGVVITYDYFWKTWKTDTKFNVYGATAYLDSLYGIDASNNVLWLYEGYKKGNSFYSMKCRTPWIKFAGIQGYQRVYKVFLLGDFKNTNVLSMGIMYDYIDEVEDTLYYTKDVSNAYGASQNTDGQDSVWGALIPYGGLERSDFEIEFRIPNQKCTAISLVFGDGFSNLPTDTGNSFQITEILVIAGIKDISTKLPITRRV